MKALLTLSLTLIAQVAAVTACVARAPRGSQPESVTSPPGRCDVTATAEGPFTDKSCGFYEELARKSGCDAAADYPLGYGRKYCERYGSLSQQVPELAGWSARTMNCLQNALADQCGTHDCKAIKDLAFRTHASCYTDVITELSGRSICDQALLQGAIVGLTVDLKDLVTVLSARQIAETLYRCGGKYYYYGSTWFKEAYKDYSIPGSNDSAGIAAGRLCVKNTTMFSIHTRKTQCHACCDTESPAESSGLSCHAVCNAQYD